MTPKGPPVIYDHSNAALWGVLLAVTVVTFTLLVAAQNRIAAIEDFLQPPQEQPSDYSPVPDEFTEGNE